MQFLGSKFNSPLEEAFYHAFLNGSLAGCFGNERKLRARIAPQYPVGPYRLDFLVAVLVVGHEPTLLGVEIDGHDFHERTKEQARRDKARDRYLYLHGYDVIRFAGSEVYRDPAACAHQAYLALRSRSAWI